jgi:hypothetical protein
MFNFWIVLEGWNVILGKTVTHRRSIRARFLFEEIVRRGLNAWLVEGS